VRVEAQESIDEIGDEEASEAVAVKSELSQIAAKIVGVFCLLALTPALALTLALSLACTCACSLSFLSLSLSLSLSLLSLFLSLSLSPLSLSLLSQTEPSSAKLLQKWLVCIVFVVLSVCVHGCGCVCM